MLTVDNGNFSPVKNDINALRWWANIERLTEINYQTIPNIRGHLSVCCLDPDSKQNYSNQVLEPAKTFQQRTNKDFMLDAGRNHSLHRQTNTGTAVHRIHEDLIFLLFKVNKLNWASRQQARVTAADSCSGDFTRVFAPRQCCQVPVCQQMYNSWE